MEVNTSGENQNGVTAPVASLTAPPGGESLKPRTGNGTRKRRRGKHKRKVTKPFVRPRVWNAERRRAGEERLRRVRAQPTSETSAPYNNNQFLMEIHAPEAEPRTRDSSFSVDSEENSYLNSLPEDEEEFLTKEFSSVYEDAASERLAGLSKVELIQEYIALEARYQSVSRGAEVELQRRQREQEQQIRELELANEKLRVQIELLRECKRLQQRASASSASSADSESDSSSSSLSTACSSRSASPAPRPAAATAPGELHLDGYCNGTTSPAPESPMCNGYHVDDTEDV